MKSNRVARPSSRQAARSREGARPCTYETRSEARGALEASRPDNLKAIRSSRGSCLPYA